MVTSIKKIPLPKFPLFPLPLIKLDMKKEKEKQSLHLGSSRQWSRQHDVAFLKPLAMDGQEL
jgi:hypothetical protein